MKEYIELFVSFFKIGLFTFGGGFAMLPMLEKEIVEKKKWATNDELLDYFAIGQCTPGVIAVNTATFIGYFRKGYLGGIIATLGVVSPSIIIITIIAGLVQNFSSYPLVQNALAGIRIGVSVLMVTSIIKLIKGSVKDFIRGIIFVLAFLLAYFTGISTAILVVIFALSGIALSYLKKGGKNWKNI